MFGTQIDLQAIGTEHGGPPVHLGGGSYLFPTGLMYHGNFFQGPPEDVPPRIRAMIRYHQELLSVIEADLEAPVLQWPDRYNWRWPIYGDACNLDVARRRLVALAYRERKAIAELSQSLPLPSPSFDRYRIF